MSERTKLILVEAYDWNTGEIAQFWYGHYASDYLLNRDALRAGNRNEDVQTHVVEIEVRTPKDFARDWVRES